MKIGTKISISIALVGLLSLGTISIIAYMTAFDMGITSAQLSVMKKLLLSATVGLSILTYLVFSVALKKMIGKPISDLTEAAKKIALGDQTANVDMTRSGQIGELVKACGALIESRKKQALRIEKLAHGDFSMEPGVSLAQDAIIFRMGALSETLNDMEKEAENMRRAVAKGDFEYRGSNENFDGGYGEVIKGFNETLDLVKTPIRVLADYAERISRGDIPETPSSEYAGDFSRIEQALNACATTFAEYKKNLSVANEAVGKAKEKASWFEGILDSVPFPVSVTDMDKNWTFINKATEESSGIRRADAIGLPCKNWGTEICGTEDCGICALVEGKEQSGFAKDGLHYQISSSYLYDSEGERIGHVEIVQDDTIIIEADKYSGIEVARLASNLSKLSQGSLDLDFSVGTGNEFTVVERQNFSEISQNLRLATDGIRAMVADVELLAQKAVKGDLSYRADASKHGGDFANIMKGVNDTLDAVTEPIKEASAVLQEVAKGNLQVTMSGDYHGDHAEIKNALNETIRNMRSYIDEISEVLSDIGNGNLNQSITGDYKGDFITIKDSLNNIIISLSQILGDIDIAAEQVTSGSRQVSDASQALSQGSTEQASTIEELTASITEIADQTKKNAIRANEANELTNQAMKNGIKGNERMQGMLDSMTEINESSASISKIIKVIDDIAFQTNILALNAAVEAARAGQHGKGFAVVAEEVRNLAGRSAEAAKETTSLIEGSITKVHAGSKLAEDTAEALKEIVLGVEKATTLVSQIAEASNEQAAGIEQINIGLEQVSEVVQNNSATAEESAAASEELFSQSEMLKQMVGSFTLLEIEETDSFETARLLAEGFQSVNVGSHYHENETNNAYELKS
ncbi:MAG: methyl-accepting chemotaxis protein [Eubacteriales bacterium]|nr:methyl-accepting chemotaxis protein [Eubacteriales bacterium]